MLATKRGMMQLSFPRVMSMRFPFELASFLAALPTKVPHLVSIYLAVAGKTDILFYPAFLCADTKC